MNFSIIQKSQLEGALRIDAEYYQPEYLEFAKRLINIGKVPLGDIAFITDGQHGYHIVDPDSEIRHITAKNVLEWLVNDNGADRLSVKTHNANKRSNLEVSDLLLSTAGTIGAVGIVQGDILPANIDQDVARIHVLDSQKVDPYFLIAFLNSKYGQFQLIRETTGQIQTHVSLDKLKSRIFVSIPNWQGKISNLVKIALDNLSKSQSIYQEAEDLLLEELGLKNAVFEDELSYVVNFSDVESANRIDPEYFHPKYQKLVEKIKSRNAKTLGELVSMRKGFEPGSEAYEEKGKLFIRVSSVSKLGIEEKDQKYLSGELYQDLKKEYEPKLGDILLTKDATPGIAYVIKEPIEGIISSGILDLKVKENIESEYLALCINSIVGQWQAQRDAGGSIIAHWKPEQVKALLIPILPIEIQKQIADLVIKSHGARKKSKELLEEAKRKVEEMIENG